METEKGDWCVAEATTSITLSYDADAPHRVIMLHLVYARRGFKALKQSVKVAFRIGGTAQVHLNLAGTLAIGDDGNR